MKSWSRVGISFTRIRNTALNYVGTGTDNYIRTYFTMFYKLKLPRNSGVPATSAAATTVPSPAAVESGDKY